MCVDAVDVLLGDSRCIFLGSESWPIVCIPVKIILWLYI